MSTRFLCAAMLSAALAVGGGVSAQTPASQYPEQRVPGQKKGMTEEKTVTLRGCLRAGTQANTFVLNNAREVGQLAQTEPEPGRPEATGTSGLTLGDYRLIAAANLNLREHVGHTVDVTGMIVPRGPAGREAEALADSGGSDVNPNMTSINVKSVRMISEKCNASPGASSPPSEATPPSPSTPTSPIAPPSVAGTTGGISGAPGQSGTVTGCLQAGSAANAFTLNNISATGGALNTTGPLQLSAAATVDLKAHTGHRVELTGTLSGTSLNVASIRHVAASCQ